jgi:hypothetical protein
MEQMPKESRRKLAFRIGLPFAVCVALGGLFVLLDFVGAFGTRLGPVDTLYVPVKSFLCKNAVNGERVYDVELRYWWDFGDTHGGESGPFPVPEPGTMDITPAMRPGSRYTRVFSFRKEIRDANIRYKFSHPDFEDYQLDVMHRPLSTGAEWLYPYEVRLQPKRIR